MYHISRISRRTTGNLVPPVGEKWTEVDGLFQLSQDVYLEPETTNHLNKIHLNKWLFQSIG